MQVLIPHFKYSTRGDVYKHFGHIDADGEVIHWIENLDDFYSALGYTASMAKAGVLPEEFIWDEYIKEGAANSPACMQMNIIEYLSKHSEAFRNKYSDQYTNLIAALADAVTESDRRCFSCSAKLFCVDSKSDRNTPMSSGNKLIENKDWIDAHYEEISVSEKYAAK